jgi:putative endonuclease
MREPRCAWLYMMANRYRGALYVGVTTALHARIRQHQSGGGSDHCAQYGLTRLVWAEPVENIQLALEHEKRLKRWRREWKFELIEKANPEWADLSQRW